MIRGGELKHTHRSWHSPRLKPGAVLTGVLGLLALASIAIRAYPGPLSRFIEAAFKGLFSWTRAQRSNGTSKRPSASATASRARAGINTRPTNADAPLRCLACLLGHPPGACYPARVRVAR